MLLPRYLTGPNVPVSKSTKQKAYKPVLPESKEWLLDFYAAPDAALRAMFPEVTFEWTSRDPARVGHVASGLPSRRTIRGLLRRY